MNLTGYFCAICSSLFPGDVSSSALWWRSSRLFAILKSAFLAPIARRFQPSKHPSQYCGHQFLSGDKCQREVADAVWTRPSLQWLLRVVSCCESAAGDGFFQHSRDCRLGNHPSSRYAVAPNPWQIGVGYHGNPGRLDVFSVARFACVPAGKPHPDMQLALALVDWARILDHRSRTGEMSWNLPSENVAHPKPPNILLEFRYCDLKAADVKAANLHHGAMTTSITEITLTESARQCLARNLRLLRAARGFSQEGLAFEAGLHRTFVAHVERGARNISIDNIEKLAIALGVRSADLLRD